MVGNCLTFGRWDEYGRRTAACGGWMGSGVGRWDEYGELEWLARWLNGWLNGRCGSIFAVVEGTMGKSVKYVAVMMLAACCAGSVLAHGQDHESVAEEVRMPERDTIASLVAEYEADIRALMDRAVEVGMLDEAGRDSVLLAAGLSSAGMPVAGGGQEAVSPDVLRARAGFLMELRQEWYVRLRGEYLRQDALTDLVGAPEQMPASAFHPRYLPLDVVEDNLKWAASRPLEVSEILARDRRLILTRMINDSAMPQFLRDLRAQNPAVYSVVAIVMGILGGAGGGFLSGSTMEMLVPRPVVGGQPWFDDMIFLDPNFDLRVYYPSLPVPQYDPENPSQQYKAALREDNGQEIRAVPIRSAGSSGPTGPPPVQRSRYDLQ